MKTIWIVNYYAMPPEYDVWGRHFEFAKNFIRAGHKVRVFASGYIYGYGKNLIPEGQSYLNTEYSGVPYTLINVPKYEGNGIQRMKSIFYFAYRMQKLRNVWDKPDIVYHNQRAPFDYPIVLMAKKLKVRYIAEAWDLWPYVFVTGGLISAKNPLMKLAYRYERKMYESASDVIFTFPGGIDYLRMHKWTNEKHCGGKIDPRHVHYINNGLNLSEFYENSKRYTSDDEELNSKDKFKVIYLGSISLYNDVKKLIEAAELLQDDPRIIFLLYGNGNQKDEMKKYVEDRGIKNVKFKSDRIPYHDCAYIVSQASLNIMNYIGTAGKWGVSTGKMFQYMAAGKPILCNVKLNYSELEKNNCGKDIRITSAQEYADAIRYFVNMPKDKYDEMCINSQEAAKQFDYEVLSKKMLAIIENKR